MEDRTMALFGNSVSNTEIDQTVSEHMLELAKTDGSEESFAKMLSSLRAWADENELGSWKRSRIAGDIESELRARQAPKDVLSAAMKLARDAML